MKNAEITNTIQVVAKWICLVAPAAFLVEVFHYFLLGQFKLVSQYFGASSVLQFFFGVAVLTVSPSLFILLSGALKTTRATILVMVGAGVALCAYLLYIHANGKWITLLVTAGVPLGVFITLKATYGILRKKEARWHQLFFALLALNALLALSTASFLEITPAIFPGTYDYIVHHVDDAFGQPASHLAVLLTQSPKIFVDLLIFIYDSLGWIFMPLLALASRESKAESLNVWRLYVGALAAATLCYAFIPLSGPLYAFGPKFFPENMWEINNIPTTVAVIQPAMRNGMPSMHFTSAVTIAFVCAALRNKFWFYLSLVFVVGTILATMGFGEHYLLDLVVALPYSATLSVLLISPKKYTEKGRRPLIALGLAGATFVAWMLLLKFGNLWLIENLNLVRALSVWSALIFLVVATYYIKSVWALEAKNSYKPAEVMQGTSILPVNLKLNRWVVGVFFMSGVAGLIYEVVFAKALAVTFGSSSLATNTVLATYMGGMAIGAWIGAKLAARSTDRLRLYVLCEAFIGLYALLTPMLFQVIKNAYVSFAWNQAPDTPELTALRLALGALVLGPATLAMGATFPIMFARLREVGIASERAIAPLYAANVGGAAFGALFAGYALLPAVGKNSATLIAALLNLLIALYVLEKAKVEQPKAIPAVPVVGINRLNHMGLSAPVGIAAVVILAVGGGVTMGLEVISMHMLAVVAGNSVYAFGLMLATFLLGLGIGSALGERFMAAISRKQVVVYAQCGLAASIVISSLQWDALAGYFANFGDYASMGVHLNFAGRELIRALVCAVAMIPSAVFIGMGYPACMSLATDWLSRTGSEVAGLGKASAINTIGNILGVLVAGFWLLPSFGSRNSLLILTLVTLGSAIAMMLASLHAFRSMASAQRSLRYVGWAPIVVPIVLLAFFPGKWDLNKLSEGSNVYFYPQNWGEVIDYAESAEGGLTTVNRNSDGILTLLTNGKFQGNNSEQGEMIAQQSFALLPLLHTRNRDSALVIGYGTGMTPRVIYEQGFKSLDISELSGDIVRLADRHFKNINHEVTSKAGVSTYFTDGRNFLLTQSKGYDLISIEITSIWFAGAANLYNKEFYNLAATRLREDGILQQWIQLHHMQPLDFIYAMQSLRSSFKYVWFYVSGGQGIVIASNSKNAHPREEYKNLMQQNLRGGTITIADLEKRLAAGPAQVDAMLLNLDPSMRALQSTDNNLYLEYSTPKGNALAYDTAPGILQLLTRDYSKNSSPNAVNAAE